MGKHVPFDVPAIVVGAGINGLGVARSLARAHVPAWLLDADAQRPEMHTRAAKSIQIASLHDDALVDELVRLGTTKFADARPVLLLTQEASVKLVSHHRERLSPLYRFSLPAPDIVEALQHKHGFQQLAEQFGAPIPRLLRVCANDDLPALETLRYPVVVKPGARDDGYSRHFKKAYRVETASEAAALLRRILPVMPDMVVQEWTEGPDSNIYFCLQYIDGDQRLIASFTGRKIRSWPPQVGGTASCAPAPEAHAELSALTADFFRDVGAVGMAAMEYKRDARSGKFRMVEPTIGRTDYQAEVASLNGVNLPYAAYCAELGHQYVTVPMKQSLAWRMRSDDERSAVAQGQRLGSGFETHDGIADALWRWSDPRPYWVQQGRRVRHALQSRVSKMVPRSQPVVGKP